LIKKSVKLLLTKMMLQILIGVMGDMKDNISILSEPLLEFRHQQETADPHDGLSLFGPYDSDAPSHPHNISFGLIGTTDGNEAFARWSQRIESAIYTEMNPRLWPLFPGFEAAFACAWPERPVHMTSIDSQKLATAASNKDEHKRAFNVVDLYLDGIKTMQKHEEPLDVILCIVPDFVYENCRPQSVIGSGTGYSISTTIRRQRETGQLDMLDHYDPEIYSFSVDFRRQIKARSMACNIPIQIIRESTLRLVPRTNISERGLTPLSDRAWNLSVALYYKAGGKPWRLKSAREGVCYIGIAYRRKDPTSSSRSACCAAQMFLDSGDGIVFMGEYGPWYSPINNQFHISREAAARLLNGVLKTYQELEGKHLKEIFLHCRSGIDRNEFAGFQDACPSGIHLLGIRVRQERSTLRLFREGLMPVIRGTFWNINSRLGYLWASGFKSRLGTYDGWETPIPLRIEIQHGDADIQIVAQDILSLTKLNYNACRLGESEPVTIGFSDAVGEILVSNPTITHRSPKFKFYI
jgi:hypothetical protein